MTSSSFVRLAILGEGLLVVLTLAWARWRDLPLELGEPGLGVCVLIGLGAAVVLAGLNFFVLCGAPDVAAIRSVRRLYVEALKPLFGGLGPVGIVTISLAAGLGEELFFRGVLQPELGLVAASVIFGTLHTGGPGTLAFGCWVAVMGAVLGALAVWTGGLVAPIVAHAVYDAAAMSYIRWGGDCGAIHR